MKIIGINKMEEVQGGWSWTGCITLAAQFMADSTTTTMVAMGLAGCVIGGQE